MLIEQERMIESVKRHNFFLLALILIVGGFLRGYDFADIPFTHDEFSAYFRTQFDNFSDLIAYGARIDGHPAGIQVFLYYWIQLFGAKEWVVKLPFFIFGLSSIYLIYRIGKLWYNSSVGLFSAALMAVSQFPVMYSVIARPYISGLFFTLLMFLFWSRLIKKPTKHFWQNGIAFVIGASLCTYNHHFSMLFAFIVGLYGLFLIPRRFIWKYLALGAFVAILYIPHLEILFHQMSMRGVEGWLAKPDPTFFVKFLGYIFNFSWMFFAAILGVLIYGYIYEFKKLNLLKTILFATLFLLPLLIGYFYSIYISAVLQFSVLIFSYPFLYFILLGHIKPVNLKVKASVVGLILLCGALSLILERKHYSIFYKDHFEHVLLDFHDAKNRDADLPAYINSRDDIVEYYANRHQINMDFKWHDDFNSPADVHAYVKKKSELHDFFYLGVNSKFNPIFLTLVQEYYPFLVFKRDYFIGTHYLFSKESIDNGVAIRNKITELDFKQLDGRSASWNHLEPKNIGSEGYEMTAEIVWSPTFETPLDSVITHRNDFIELKLEYFSKEPIESAQVVLTLDKGSENIYWLSLPLNHVKSGGFNPDAMQKAFATLKLSDIKNLSGSTLKAYVWNENREEFTISKISIYKSKGNPILYGLFQPV
jgi:hypothetical protein